MSTTTLKLEIAGIHAGDTMGQFASTLKSLGYVKEDQSAVRQLQDLRAALHSQGIDIDDLMARYHGEMADQAAKIAEENRTREMGLITVQTENPNAPGLITKRVTYKAFVDAFGPLDLAPSP